MGDQTVNVGPGIYFSPSSIVVAPGEKVTWVWNGAYHSSTSDSMTGPEVWNSGIMSTGSFDHTFTVPGLYPFYCMVHSYPGGTLMNGTVQVVPASTPTPAPTVTPPPVVTLPPASTPPSTTPPSGGAVPTLGTGGLLVLALSLAGLAYLLLNRAAR